MTLHEQIWGASILWDIRWLESEPATLEIFAGTLWKMKSEGFIFCQHLWKIGPKGPNFVGFFEEKIQTSLFQNPPS